MQAWNASQPATHHALHQSCPDPGADPGFLLEGGAPLRNDVTIQDFS